MKNLYFFKMTVLYGLSKGKEYIVPFNGNHDINLSCHMHVNPQYAISICKALLDKWSASTDRFHYELLPINYKNEA